MMLPLFDEHKKMRQYLYLLQYIIIWLWLLSVKLCDLDWLLCGLESSYLGQQQCSVRKVMDRQIKKCKQANALARKKD